MNEEDIKKYQERKKKYRQKVLEYIQKEQLVSFMNKTKWEELRSAMYAMEISPSYRIKYLFSADNEQDIEKIINENISYGVGVWGEEQFYNYFDIEWVKIEKLREEPQGRLIAPQILDYSQEIRAVLEKFHIPYEEHERFFTIYGYKRVKKE
ncbi:MAG: hypothetical protein Q4C98_10375 [Capnocytophaga sp.]|nr:hypothetical protein [Capnocytophaga sp.]